MGQDLDERGSAPVRVRVLSDLHLEFGDVTLHGGGADCVVLAGDIHLGTRGIEWAARTFPDVPVVYVLGNHECYGRVMPDFIQVARERGAALGVHVLHNEARTVCGVRFLGATLWSDLQLHGGDPEAIAAVHEGMTDFRKIRVRPTYRKLVPTQVMTWHREAVRWLQTALAEPSPLPTVIVTHHAPSDRSLEPTLVSDPLSAAYASHLDALVAGSGSPYWIHGHTHWNCRYTLGETLVLCNQRGYSGQEATGFDEDMTLMVHPKER